MPHLKPTATARSTGEGDAHVRGEGRPAVTAAMLLRYACLGGNARAQGPVPRLMGAVFGAPTAMAEFKPRLSETALERRFPSPTSEHDQRKRRSKRAFLRAKKKINLAGRNHDRSASSRRRYYAMRIIRRRRRSPCALDRGNPFCVIGQASNRTRVSSKTKRGAPWQCCQRCRTAVELSIAVTECLRLARERISGRVVGGSKEPSTRKSGGRTGERARGTTIVIRRLCGIVVAV